MSRRAYVLTMVALGCFMMAAGVRAHDGESLLSFGFVMMGLVAIWTAAWQIPK